MSFTVGQLVRLNPDMISKKEVDDHLNGDLGFPSLMQHFVFEVIELVSDPTRGEMMKVIITNPDIIKTMVEGVKEVKYEGELLLLCKDTILANSKITLDYVIEMAKSKNEILAELFVEREKIKAKGYDKRNKEMRANWNDIQIVRGEVVGKMPSIAGNTIVSLPKHRIKFDNIEAKDLPTNDEESIKKFKSLLSNKLRGIRNLRKQNVIENKIVFGMIPIQKMGGVYLKSNSLLKAYEEMMKTTLETDKKPTDAKATYVGIEVEFIYTGKYDVLKKLLIDAKLHRNVCLKNDASVRPCHNTGYQGKELTLLCKDNEVEDIMKRLDSVLAHPEIDGFSNRSCGLHVHLDIRNRDADLVYKNLVRVQGILRGSQPVGRVNNIYCKANTSDNLDKKAAIDGGGRDNRYWVVNGMSFARHNSIEIRIHEGTTNCEDIYNWVSFLVAIANHKIEIPKNELKFAEDLVSKFDINIPLNAIDYVDRRIERFKSLTLTTAAVPF